jgi:hypothetical protein
VLTELSAATTLDEVEALLPRHIDLQRLQNASEFGPVG